MSFLKNTQIKKHYYMIYIYFGIVYTIFNIVNKGIKITHSGIYKFNNS